MNATKSDTVIFALVIALGGTLAFMSAILMRSTSVGPEAAFDTLVGVGLIAWLYAAITGLEMVSRRTFLHVCTAAFITVPIAVLLFL
ncbi:hypothetical protein [Roseovarius autotrophicus]|uniref:hypothetical protein n=1 Tax=Roseovarius autotrophicus TaxID=2824121 RepID=UPI0019E35CCB|nr:hypothetical protein [Roseovarius autotrophicus]MBE0453608.1 hypothetical protein [Roseovarius sp.]